MPATDFPETVPMIRLSKIQNSRLIKISINSVAAAVDNSAAAVEILKPNKTPELQITKIAPPPPLEITTSVLSQGMKDQERVASIRKRV
jgi:hypothetical protein